MSLKDAIRERLMKDRVPSADYLKNNPDASQEPIKDALLVNIISLEDTIKKFREYVDSNPQSKMTVSHISRNYLQKIDYDVQVIRKYLNITRSSDK